jgi:hypothetical protein
LILAEVTLKNFNKIIVSLKFRQIHCDFKHVLMYIIDYILIKILID